MATESGSPIAAKGKRTRGPTVPPALKAKIVKLYALGWTPSEIRDELVVVELNTIKHFLWRHGHKRNSANAPDAECDVAPADALEHWRATAHPAQLPPDGAWSTWLFQGGRGAGKTRAGAEWIAAQAAEKGGVYALIGATLRDVREVMIDGPSGLMHLPNRARPRFEAGRRRLVWDGSGAVAYTYSSQEPERLRGPQFDAAWADEFCAWKAPMKVLEVLRFGLRRGADPRLVVTTTPKPTKAFKRLRAEKGLVVTHAGSAANAANLSPRFFEMLNDLYVGTTLATQELEGLVIEGEAPLFRAQMFIDARGGRPVAFDRVVVGVDPPAGESGGSACGIVVVGKRDNRGYVLADRTRVDASPLAWAHAVRDAAAYFGASAVVAEVNQGGAMVRTVLASAGVAAPIRLVHAREGKRARAEPVAGLYEQGRIVHVGAFPQLEEELMALGEAEMEGRLDRADALVWAVTDLLVDAPPRQGPRLSQL
jgi:phage terminase large subunit-like protein